jgi:hypothetical protein
MNTVYKAYVYSPDDYTNCFIGEIEGVNIKTNIVEIQNTPVEFYGDTKQKLLEEMIKYLKSKGKSGFLRIVN